MTPILACKDLSVRFGGFSALSNVSLDFLPGKTTAIIGPNGAGKTTLINVLSGILKPSNGRIYLKGDDVTRLRPDQLARRGVGRSFQIVKIFNEMTVRENIRIAAQLGLGRVVPFWKPAGGDDTVEAKIDEILQLVGLSDLADADANKLSHGKQRALELGLTLINEPPLLMLDEPLAGVGNSEVGWMTEIINLVRGTRTTLIIEHNMDAVMSMADEIVVLVAGEVLTRGTPSEVISDQRVRTAYLGN